MKKLVDSIKSRIGSSKDYIFKDLKILNKNISLIFNEVLTDSEMINDFVLRRLINIKRKKILNI